MRRDLTANSIQDFVGQICALKPLLRQDGGLYNEIMLFRGQADKDFELMPGIGRERTASSSISIFNEERNLIELAKYKMPDIFRAEMQPIDLLALLQHHGIPTRLLDVTENAFVALYFACCSKVKEDGEVIVFVHNETDVANYPVAHAIADCYRFAHTTLTSISSFYEDVLEQPYFLEQRRLNRVCNQTSEIGAEWIADCCKKPHFIYAPIRTARQLLQRGRYLLFPNKISYFHGELVFESSIEAMPKDHPCITARIIIPAAAKGKMMEDLEAFGISREALFADSVDAVCQSITSMLNYKLDAWMR